jgi:hypothetical protein
LKSIVRVVRAPTVGEVGMNLSSERVPVDAVRKKGLSTVSRRVPFGLKVEMLKAPEGFVLLGLINETISSWKYCAGRGYPRMIVIT